jgi:hypothetical protein
VGVADGGNQIRVEVGGGVSVMVMGVGVVRGSFIPLQAVKHPIRRTKMERRLKVMLIGDIFSFHCGVK